MKENQMYFIGVFYFTDPMRCDRRCRHLLTSSFLLFRRSFLMRMWYFSSIQRLHLFDDPLYGVALSIMSQDRSYSSFFSLRCHIYLLSSVEFFRLLLLNDCQCPYSLLLNVPSVSPTYFFVSVSDLTVASYITPWSKQCPSTGQVLFLLQLQVLSSSPLLISRLLWLLIVLSMFGIQL